MANDRENIGPLSSDSNVNGTIIWNKAEAQRKRFFLRGKSVGISISESEDLGLYGFSIDHLQDLLIEISRYILSVGGGLTYGGDLRNGGFTSIICDLVEVYKDFENSSDKRFVNYLAWPLSLELTNEHILKYKNRVSFIPIAPPKHLSIKDQSQFLKPGTLETQLIWADCLSSMRDEMDKNCQARIFIGGRVHGFKGRLPGLLEEFLIAIQHDKPIYLLGAFGGITKRIVEFSQGKNEHIFDPDDKYSKFIEFYNSKSLIKIDLEGIEKEISSYGLERIISNSGLKADEYLSLMTNQNITSNIYLILKGLSKKF
jgi:hypothetical protein